MTRAEELLAQAVALHAEYDALMARVARERVDADRVLGIVADWRINERLAVKHG